jgi:integrase
MRSGQHRVSTSRNSRPAPSNHARRRAAFAWAVKRGMARQSVRRSADLAKSIAKRDSVLSDLPRFGRRPGKAGAPYRSIIRLLILIGQRRGEVAAMTWGEISDDLAPGPCRASAPRTALRISCH